VGRQLEEGWLIHYEVHDGAGPYLLLVHGMLASRAQWRLNLDALSRVSRPVVVELLGHGRSCTPEDPDAYRPEGYVAAFERIRESLGVERWVVCGQSLGGALTLRYALDHPERAAAQVFTNSNSALAEEGWGDRIRAAMQAQAQVIEARGREAIEAMPIHPRHSRRMPPDVKRALVDDSVLHDPRGILCCGLYTVPDSPVRARVRENRVPALLVCGEREQRFAPHRDYAEKAMPRLEVVSVDAGHAVNIEAAAPFNAAVTDFIRRSSG
jgi:2-succinyl-6-hydroxy-2,4-cyclohexadiene-1-carboxylate synthase